MVFRDSTDVWAHIIAYIDFVCVRVCSLKKDNMHNAFKTL